MLAAVLFFRPINEAVPVAGTIWPVLPLSRKTQPPARQRTERLHLRIEAFSFSHLLSTTLLYQRLDCIRFSPNCQPPHGRFSEIIVLGLHKKCLKCALLFSGDASFLVVFSPAAFRMPFPAHKAFPRRLCRAFYSVSFMKAW